MKDETLQELLKRYRIRENDPLYRVFELFFEVLKGEKRIEKKIESIDIASGISEAVSSEISKKIKEQLTVKVSNISLDYDKLARAILRANDERSEKKEDEDDSANKTDTSSTK